MEGPIIGAVVFMLFQEYLSGLGPWQFIILGSISILIVAIEPKGLWGLIRRVLPEDLLPVSRQLIVTDATETLVFRC